MLLSRRLRIALTGSAIVVAAGCAAAFALVWHTAIAPVTPPDRASFAPALIARGAELAAIGDCAVCHTAKDGRPYVGGRGVPTPFGIVYATNITPDPDTGIGNWSEPAFRRAMRDGIDRAGRHLYPVLPYPHFTRASDADIGALYAFMMTRPKLRQDTPPNGLPFPFNFRAVLAGWNLLYLRPGPWRPDAAHDDAWNRGAYLVEAVGHCGACHTPHNLLGAEQGAQALAGGQAEGWYAPALQSASPARLAWTEESLATYLQTGFHAEHGAAGGPMTAVTDELANVPAEDIRAMATYLAALMPKGSAEPPPMSVHDGGDQAAATIFAGACGGCHGADAPMTRGGAPSLSLSSAVNAPAPQGVIKVILDGIPWREGRPAPFMPAFGAMLTDTQVAAVTEYLRARYSDQPPWTDLPGAVASARRDGGAS